MPASTPLHVSLQAYAISANEELAAAALEMAAQSIRAREYQHIGPVEMRSALCAAIYCLQVGSDARSADCAHNPIIEVLEELLYARDLADRGERHPMLHIATKSHTRGRGQSKEQQALTLHVLLLADALYLGGARKDCRKGNLTRCKADEAAIKTAQGASALLKVGFGRGRHASPS